MLTGETVDAVAFGHGELKSLTYAKWCITEFCKQVARYPLWSLLYCDKIKEKENCKKAISDLISLFNQDSYSLPKIKELLKEIKNDQIDLYVLLTNNQNYKNGFNNFIHGIEDVELKEERLFSMVYIVGTGLAISLVMVLSIVLYVKFAPLYPDMNRGRELVWEYGVYKKADGKGINSSSLSYALLERAYEGMEEVEAVTDLYGKGTTVEYGIAAHRQYADGAGGACRRGGARVAGAAWRAGGGDGNQGAV